MSRTSQPAQRPQLGRIRTWARDFAVLGGLSSAMIPLVALGGRDPWTFVVSFTAVALGVGALLGALVGGAARVFIGRIGARLPVGLLLLVGPIVGALWGAAAGGAAGYLWWWAAGTATFACDGEPIVGQAAGYAAIAAAVQFGWFWLPYTLGVARRERLAGLWVLAGLSAGAVGLLMRGFV